MHFYNSKKYSDLVAKIHDTINEESNFENNKNYVEACNAGLKAW